MNGYFTMLESRKSDSAAFAAASASTERRNHARYSFTATGDVVDARSNTRIQGRISDLGRGGCYVDTMSPFAVDTEVRIRITRDQKILACEGKVVYSAVGMGMGLMFAAIAPEHLWVLDSWLAELSGSPLPERLSLEYNAKNGSGAGGGGTLSPTASAAESNYVLNELIIALMRKHVLTDAEGNDMLQKLLRNSR
ncbi:MAG TPA: PilZ domain-containing protein [Candidatus Acidoferrum sp.]|jgi:hypothetical protein